MPHSRAWPANHTQPHLVSVVGDNDLLVGGSCPHTPWSSYQQLHAINTKGDIPFLYMTAFQLHFKYKFRMVVKTFHSPRSVKKCSIDLCPKFVSRFALFCYDSTLSEKWCTFLTSRSSNETGRLMTHCRCCVGQTIKVQSLSAHLGVNVSRK